MKSINQIFNSNPDLKEYQEVQELMEYCRELEGQVMESTQAKQFSFEDKLTELVRDVFRSIKDVEKIQEESDRFGFDEPDYRECVGNLKKYIQDFSRDNKFRL